MKENNHKNMIYHFGNKKEEYDNEFANDFEMNEDRQLTLQKIQDKSSSKIVKKKAQKKITKKGDC